LGTPESEGGLFLKHRLPRMMLPLGPRNKGPFREFMVERVKKFSLVGTSGMKNMGTVRCRSWWGVEKKKSAT